MNFVRFILTCDKLQVTCVVLKMESRQTIEEFLVSIDEDLLKYADSFRKHGFTSNTTMKYITDEDLTSLIAMPEGHKRLIKNVISRMKTPDKKPVKKRKEFPSPGLSPEMKQASKRAEITPATRTRRSLPIWSTPETVDFMDESRSVSASCNTRSRRSLELLSPAENYVKSKETEILATEHEIAQRNNELDEMMDDIKSAAKEVGTVGLKCSNCHLRNHTVRSCASEKCESPFDCGDLKKHPDVKAKIVERKREIGKLQSKLKKLQQEHAGREAAFTRVHRSINKDLEDILIDEFPDEYTNNGVRNWLKLQRDVAYVKRGIKSSGPPKREEVRSLLLKRIDDDFERSFGFPSTPVFSAGNQESCSTAIRKTVESFGVKYPTKSQLSSCEKEKIDIKYDDKLFPDTAEEEAEQINMATRLSSLVFDKSQTASTCTSTTENNIIQHLVYDSDETQDPNEHKSDEAEEVANILLSLVK